MGSPRGTYLVIADRLRADLSEVQPGTDLPSEAELRSKFGVSRGTVRRALAVLAYEDLVEPVPGYGWRTVSDERHTPIETRLRRLISEDGLRVGDPFPPEHGLSDRLGVSRTAVRRGLAQLEGDGILSVSHGKGRAVLRLP